MALKEMKELLEGRRLTVPQVVTLYNAKVRVSSGEAVNIGFVDSATVVWETLLRHGPLQQLVVAAVTQITTELQGDSVVFAALQG